MSIDYDKILIIKLDNNDFEKFYNYKIRESKIDVWDVEKLRSHLPHHPIKNMLSGIGNMFNKELRNSLKKYELIIVFEDQGLIPVLYQMKKKETRLILWNWNIMNEQRAKKENLFSKYCEIWTFDKMNAEKYGWKINRQFYFPTIEDSTNEKKITNKKSAFCVCTDKGRYSIAKKIKKELELLNVKCDFRVVKERGKKYNPEDEDWLIENNLPYKDFLEGIRKCNFVVDIVQNNQIGMTVRVMEALFYNKKIITNNVYASELPFYDDEKIFIYNNTAESSLGEFIENTDIKYDEKFRKMYSFTSWIENFISKAFL